MTDKLFTETDYLNLLRKARLYVNSAAGQEDEWPNDASGLLTAIDTVLIENNIQVPQ
jgi:hypothetical protein